MDHVPKLLDGDHVHTKVVQNKGLRAKSIMQKMKDVRDAFQCNLTDLQCIYLPLHCQWALHLLA